VQEWVDRLSAWLERTLGLSSDLQSKLFGTVAVFVILAVTTRLGRRITARAISNAPSRYSANKAINYTFGVLALAIVAKIWVQGITGLATYFGLLSAGVAVALQDPLINLAGWLFIVTRSPLEVGDRIQIGAHKGDVVDIRLFSFTILEIGNWVNSDQSTGRVIHIPNGWVFKNSVASYDRGFRYIWNEISVLITYESNWRRAKQVLQQTVNAHAEHLTEDATKQIDEAAERYHIKFSKLTPMVWTQVADSGIRLSLRYLCSPRNRRGSEHEMWESILEAFEELDDVELAYPTVRYYDNAVEAKPNARLSRV